MRPGRPGRGTRGRLVGRHDRARGARSTPTATSWSAPTCWAGARAPPGRPRPAPNGTPYGSRFPLVTIRDQVAVEVALADHLGIDRWAGVIGRLHGRDAGPRVVRRPPRPSASGRRAGRRGRGHRRADRPVLAADPGHHAPTPLRRRRLLRHRGPTQRRARPRPRHRAVHLPDRPRARGPLRPEPPRRRRTRCKGGRFAVESYLEHHGDKLARRFDPNSYVVLSEAMNHHDVGRGPQRRGPGPGRGPCRGDRGRHRLRPPVSARAAVPVGSAAARWPCRSP